MPKKPKKKGGKLPDQTVIASTVKKKEWYQEKPILILILSVGILFLIAFAIETKQNEKPANIQKVVKIEPTTTKAAPEPNLSSQERAIQQISNIFPTIIVLGITIPFLVGLFGLIKKIRDD